MSQIKKTPAKTTKAEAKKPVVKKVAAKRTAAKPAVKPVVSAAKEATKKVAKSNVNGSAVKPIVNKVKKLAPSNATMKFSALPKNSLFKLGGRHYVKNFQGKALLLPPSVNLSKGDAKISAIHVMATEVVTIKASELVERV